MGCVGDGEAGEGGEEEVGVCGEGVVEGVFSVLDAGCAFSGLSGGGARDGVWDLQRGEVVVGDCCCLL